MAGHVVPAGMSGVRRFAGRASAAAGRAALSIRRALSLPAPRESALLVPVPAFDGVLGELRDRYGLPSTPGIPAHVTVLYPFVPPGRLTRALPSLEALVARVEKFPFTLRTVGRFPGVLYAEPVPGDPFVQLTEAVVRRWPSRLPYRGRFPSTVPHCTVTEGPEPDGLAEDLAGRLPLESVAEELWVVEERDGGWRRVAVVELGG